jgi:hypothetical protein
MANNTMTKLQTITVGSGGAASVTFSAIPQTYTDLVVKVSARDVATGISWDNLRLAFNNISSGYGAKLLYGTSSTAASLSDTVGTYFNSMYIDSADQTANTFGNLEISIPNYTSSNYKSVSWDGAIETNSAAGLTYLGAGLLSNATAISSMTFTPVTGNFAQYSEFTLYGVYNSTTTPSAPTIASATDLGGGTAQVAISSPSGAYTVTASPGGATATSASPINISGLSPQTSYTFTAQAAAPFGVSAASSASSSVSMYNGMTALATVNVGSGGLSTIQFNSIPSGYNHLQIRAISRGTNAAANDASIMQFNGDTGSNYYTYHQIFGDGSSAAANSGGTGSSIAYIFGSAGSALANSFAGSILDILDYSNTNKNKTVRNLEGFDVNGSGGYIVFRSGLWINTAAISSITLTPQASSFAQYSSFTLYGVK